MGQKVNPYGFRLGVTTDWKSRWFATRDEYVDYLIEDWKIRDYLMTQLPHAAISRVEVERTRDRLPVEWAQTQVNLGSALYSLAVQTGDRNALAMASVVRALLLGELGRVDEMWRALASARSQVEELRMVYAELVLDEVELAWTAAAGRFDDCDALLVGIDRRLRMLSMAGGGDDLSVGKHFDLFALQLWQGRPLAALPGLRARIEAGVPMEAFLVVALWRGGRDREANEAFDPEGLHALIDREMAFSTPLRCAAAEAALHAGDAELGRHAYRTLLPYAGRSSGADGLFFGPTDAFLALAARACGDLAAASEHADRAAELMDAWELSAARAWLDQVRSTHGI